MQLNLWSLLTVFLLLYDLSFCGISAEICVGMYEVHFVTKFKGYIFMSQFSEV